jgi:hypothetical protein
VGHRGKSLILEALAHGLRFVAHRNGEALDVAVLALGGEQARRVALDKDWVRTSPHNPATNRAWAERESTPAANLVAELRETSG